MPFWHHRNSLILNPIKFDMPRILLLLFVAFFLVPRVHAQQSSDELRKQQQEIQQEINDLKRTLAATQKNRKAGLGQLAMIQKKIRLREKAIGNINDQINVIQSTINQSRTDISRLKEELDTLKVRYEKSIVYAYKNRSNYDFLNFIFSASNFNDALKRLEYLKSYRAYREQQATIIQNTQLLLQNKIVGLEATRRQKDEVLQKQEKEKIALVDERKEKDEIVNKLRAREKELNKELSAKAKADRKLRDGVAAAIRREMAKEAELAKKKEASNAVTNPNTSTTNRPTTTKPKSVFTATPEGAIVSDNFEKNKGRLPWPVENGNIKIHYGLYSIEGTSLKGNNPGLTIETSVNGSVKSVFDGDVINVFDIDGNWAILIQHGKYFTSYSGLSTVNVSKGEKVRAGQLLGKAGSNDEGNGEIEFLLMQEAKNINPEPWIKRK